MVLPGDDANDDGFRWVVVTTTRNDRDSRAVWIVAAKVEVVVVVVTEVDFLHPSNSHYCYY
jgi:hypothetical protein